jgi:hypothetical protein
MVRGNVSRGIYAAIFSRERQCQNRDRRKGNPMRGRRLQKWRVQRRHGLAAILTVPCAVRSAWHSLAALHRLIRRGHRRTVHRIAREGERNEHHQNWPEQSHPKQR